MQIWTITRPIFSKSGGHVRDVPPDLRDFASARISRISYFASIKVTPL